MIAVNHAGDHIQKIIKITGKILSTVQRCSVEVAENLASYFTCIFQGLHKGSVYLSGVQKESQDES